MEPVWRVELLGGLRAVDADRAVTRFRTHKTAALLASLAYYADRPHSRKELTNRYWPEGEGGLDGGPVAPGASFRKALASLRRQLEPPGVAPGSVIVAARKTVRLDSEAVSTDVAQFEFALDSRPK